MKKRSWIAASLVLGALTLSAFPSAYGDTRTRAITITTDAFSGSFAIDVMQGANGAVTEMLYQTPTNPNGVLTLEQLHQGPQVVFNTEGHDVILMSLESDFDPMKGGHTVVRYLKNAIEGSYKDFRVLIDLNPLTLRSDPDPNDADSDGNSYNGVFNQLFMQKNTVLGITVGIQNVVPSYQQ